MKIYCAPQTELTDFVMVAALCGSKSEPVSEEIGGQSGKPGGLAPRRRPF